MARLLYLSSSSPVPAKLGPARRNFEMIRQLSREYDVTVLTVGSQEQEALFRSLLGDAVADTHFVQDPGSRASPFVRKAWRTATQRCDFLPAVDERLKRACHTLIQTGRFDAIVLSHVLLQRLLPPTDIPVIGDTHNVEFDALRRLARATNGSFIRRLYAALQWPATRREERRSGRAVDLVLATSSRDAALFTEELDIPRVVVIENGIDLQEFAAHPPHSGSRDLLFCGLMSYYPNQHAVDWFLGNVMPLILERRTDVRFIVAGATPPPWLIARASSHVVVTGAVPDMRPYLEQAAVVVAPIWHGGGTRVKILEAMSFSRPVVSTTIGAEGLRATHNEMILLADDSRSFANATLRMLNDPTAASRIAESGRAHVEQNFDWDVIGRRLRASVRDVISRAPVRQIFSGTR